MGITGAMKSTPTAALEALLNIEPLHIHIEAVARASFLRLDQSSLFVGSNTFEAMVYYDQRKSKY